MSQPNCRGALIPPPGKIDTKLGEFWSSNPWHIVAGEHNLSCFERNRVFLNVRGRAFVEVSYLTGADSDGDGRGVVAGDFRNNGRQELVVRQAGGGPFMLFENQFPQRHYLKVSLRGTRSNRQGVGARVVALAGGQQIVREMFPHNTFLSQMPNIIHLGLADAPQVDRLTIRWPSGAVQELTNVRGDRHVVITEDRPPETALETVVPGKRIEP